MKQIVPIYTEMPEKEHLLSGHLACAGCGAALAMRLITKILGENTAFVLPACCAQSFARRLDIPYCNSAFASAAACAGGLKAGFDVKGHTDVNVVVWAGDGGTFDIGMQALSGAAERNENIIYICYDNEAYMATGVQRSSATPPSALTRDTPIGHLKVEPKKDLIQIMVAHRIPYAATATIAYISDLIEKVSCIKSIYGFRLLHVLTPCPTGWQYPPDLTVELSRLAVETKIFPLYEVKDGRNYNIYIPSRTRPVKEYLQLQGRWSHLSNQDLKTMQQNVNENWKFLLSNTTGRKKRFIN